MHRTRHLTLLAAIALILSAFATPAHAAQSPDLIATKGIAKMTKALDKGVAKGSKVYDKIEAKMEKLANKPILNRDPYLAQSAKLKAKIDVVLNKTVSKIDKTADKTIQKIQKKNGDQSLIDTVNTERDNLITDAINLANDAKNDIDDLTEFIFVSLDI